MRPALRPIHRLRFSVWVGAWLAVAGWGPVQAAPPADGIQDDTRALPPEVHRQLAEELKLARQDLKCEAWILASSFTPPGITLRRQAQITRRDWSQEQPAVLLAYDRASNSSAMSFAPICWERYSAAELVGIMQETRRILTDAKLTLEERFVLATHSWIDRMRTLESIRLKQSLWLQRSEKHFALAIPALLGGGGAIVALLGFVSRRRSARADLRFLFPDVQVGMRFGAAYGGGVTSEIRAHASPQ